MENSNRPAAKARQHAEERQRRLAEELRANLRRRKDQARARADDSSVPPAAVTEKNQDDGQGSSSV